MEQSSDIAQEMAALQAIFDDRVVVLEPSIITINLGGSDEKLFLSLRTVPEYPMALPDIELEGDVSKAQVARFVKHIASRQEELLGKPMLYDICMELTTFAAGTDMTSSLSLEDERFLHSSCESLVLKESLGLDMSVDLLKSSDSIVKEAQDMRQSLLQSTSTSGESKSKAGKAIAKLTVAKRRMCSVCGAQAPKHLPLINGRFYCPLHRCSTCDTPLSSPITVAGVSQCPAHAQSGSSRSADVGKALSRADIKEEIEQKNASRFNATKMLLTQLVVKCVAGEISIADLMGVFTVINTQRGYTATQQSELESLVTSRAEDYPDAVSCMSIESLEHTMALINGSADRIGLLPSQLQWIESFIQSSIDGFRKGPLDAAPRDSSVEEIRLLSQLYCESFILQEPSYLNKANGVASTARIELATVPISLELFIFFYEENLQRCPTFEFGSVQGLTTGDLNSLATMLSYALDMSAYSALQMVNRAAWYVSDAAERAQGPKLGKYDFPYAHLTLNPTRYSTNIAMPTQTLDQLDQSLMKLLSESVASSSSHAIYGVENIVSRTTFSRFRAQAAKIFESTPVAEGTLLPIVGWHGTPTFDNIQSIVRDGILAPGDLTEDGNVIRSIHGQAFGAGIYVSNDLTTASNFGPQLPGGVCQLFFSIVLPGRHHYYQFNNKDGDRQNRAAFDSTIVTVGSRGNDLYVVYDADFVLPFFLVTIGPKGTDNARKYETIGLHTGKDAFGDTRIAATDNFNLAKKRRSPEASWKLLRSRQHWDCSAEEMAAREGGILAYRIPSKRGMHWLVAVAPTIITGLYVATPIRLIFCVPKTMTSIVGRACEMFQRSMVPDHTQAVMYGASGVSFVPNAKLCQGGSSFTSALNALEETSGGKILGGIERCIEVILTDLENLRASGTAARGEASDPVFLIVLVTSGKDGTHTAQEAEVSLRRLMLQVQGASAKIMVRAVNIGRHADTPFVLQTKLSIETMYSYESVALSYARTRNEVARLLHAMAGQLKRQNYARFACKDFVVGEGFVHNILQPAVSSVEVGMRPGEYTSLLMRGALPRQIRVANRSVKLMAWNDSSWMDDPALQAQLLATLRRHVDDIAIAIVSGRTGLEGALEEIRFLLQSIATTVCDPKNIVRPQERVALMKKKKQFLVEIRELLNRAQSALLLKGATKDAQARWLVRIDSLQYGLRALRRALPVDLDAVHSQLRRLGGEPFESHPQDLVSVRTKMTTVSSLADMALAPKLSSIMDYLYSYGIVGLASRFRRSEASVIDSWAMHVDHVGNEGLDTASAMILAEAGIAHEDSLGEACRDVLLIGDPRNFRPYLEFSKTLLFRYYHSMSFALNPNLFNPRMGTAILAIALVRAACQLLTPRRQDTQSLENFVKLRFTLRMRYIGGEESASVSYWNSLVDKLHRRDVASHLTEAAEDDIGSIAKVLAVVICLSDRIQFFSDPAQLSVVFLALMAETSSRGARIEVKKHGGDSHQLLMRALGIQPESCVHPLPVDEEEPKRVEHSNDFDAAAGRKYSGRFFHKELLLSNAPPNAVLASLAISRYFHSLGCEPLWETDDWSIVVEGLRAELQRTSMKTCIPEMIFPDKEAHFDPIHLQIALYVQALKFHNSASRRGVLLPLRDPERVIRNVSEGVRREYYGRLLRDKLKHLKGVALTNKKHRERMILLERRGTFLETHSGLPRVFSVNQASDLGLEITETGLPVSVCSYPSCAMYLQPLGPQPLTNADMKSLEQHLSINGKDEAVRQVAISINEQGVPICRLLSCRFAGQKLLWCSRDRAEKLGIEAETDAKYFYFCLGCKLVIKRPGAVNSVPNRRHYLYFHLSPLLYPENRIYAKAMHLTAKTKIVAHSSQLEFYHFAKSMVQQFSHLALVPGENWVDLLRQLYDNMAELFGKQQVGGSMQWAAKMSQKEQQKLVDLIVSLVDPKMKWK